MTKRLQVRPEASKLREIERLAAQQRMTVRVGSAGSARSSAGRFGCTDGPQAQGCSRGVAHRFPTGDIEEINVEIGRGYSLDELIPLPGATGSPTSRSSKLEARDVARAKGLVLERPPLSARDAIHVAIMERYEVPRLLTFDRGFDAVPAIRRV